MLLSIGSSLPTFKTLTFRPGLNILQANRTSNSTEGQTRNSAGKTSFVEILHFLLGADFGRGFLSKPEFVGESFHGTFRFGDRSVEVTRTTSMPDRVIVSASDAAALGLTLTDDEEGRTPPYVTVSSWKEFLGHRWFKLPSPREGTEFEKAYSPSFRALFSYFARRTVSGAFAHPERSSSRQQPWDWQTNLAYLIGLDWKLPRERQELRVKSESLKKLRGAIKSGELGKLFGSAAELRPEIVRVDEQITVLRGQVEAFTVHEQYEELAASVATIRNEMTAISREIAALDETIQYLSKSIDDEKPPAYADLEALYASAQVELPGMVLKRFDEADRFRRSVARNRALYLQSQIDEATRERAEHAVGLKELDERKSAILKELSGKGAFADLNALQEQLALRLVRKNELVGKLQNANILENDKAGQKRDEAELFVRLQVGLTKTDEQIRKAVSKVDHAISELYDDRKGNLIIEAVKGGFSYSVQIDGGGNQGGIDMMKVFCFDMMLFDVVADRFGGPGFLVHDSHLFDGVDARQIHSAIVYGGKIADKVTGQYIVTMNSDLLDAAREHGEAEIDSAVLPASLNDMDTGGLFGFRFD